MFHRLAGYKPSTIFEFCDWIEELPKIVGRIHRHQKLVIESLLDHTKRHAARLSLPANRGQLEITYLGRIEVCRQRHASPARQVIRHAPRRIG